MKVNFDNIRKKTTKEFNELGKGLDKLLEQYDWEVLDKDMQEIVAKYNNLREMIITLNCLHDDEVADDINDLANLHVMRI